MRRFLIPALLLAAVPAYADDTTGTILAYDRLENILVLSDKTIWQLDAATLVPADLKAGDQVKIEFQSKGDEGITKIFEMSRIGN